MIQMVESRAQKTRIVLRSDGVQQVFDDATCEVYVYK